MTRDEILDHVTFTERREKLYEASRAAKEARRIHVGEHLTFLFENADTMRWQIQEIMRVERLVRESDVQHEIDTYNEILGGPATAVVIAASTKFRNGNPKAYKAFYEALKVSALDWTLACTPRLVDGPPTDAFRSSADYLPEGTGSITTEDVASFLLCEAVDAHHVRERVGLNGSR